VTCVLDSDANELILGRPDTETGDDTVTDDEALLDDSLLALFVIDDDEL